MSRKPLNWAFIGAVIAVDQFVKIIVANFFSEILIKNPGLPFGIDLPGVFDLIAVSAALLIFMIGARGFFLENSASEALIIGGALSNLGDRMTLGYVRDYIHIWVGTLNLADVAVWGGIVLLLFDNLKSKNQNVK